MGLGAALFAGVVLATGREETWEPACPLERACPSRETVELGRSLFLSPALSPARRSCATCHEPANGYGASAATNLKFKTLPRSIPSLLNLSHQRWFFWDGRADQLWQQAIGPLESETEMNSHRLFMVAAVVSNSQLRDSAIAGGALTAREMASLRPRTLASHGLCEHRKLRAGLAGLTARSAGRRRSCCAQAAVVPRRIPRLAQVAPDRI